MSEDLTQGTLDGTGEPAVGETGGHSPDPVMREKVVAALKSVYDPEIPVDIWELGLVYRIDIDSDNNVEIDMTVTAPSCPVAEELPLWVQQAVEEVEEVKSCRIEMVWEPPWHPDLMSEEAKVELNFF